MCVACVYTAEHCVQSLRCVFWHLVNHTHYLISSSLYIAAPERPNNAAIMHKHCNSTVFFIFLMLSPFNQNLCFLLMFPPKCNHSCDGRAHSIMVVLS